MRGAVLSGWPGRGSDLWVAGGVPVGGGRRRSPRARHPVCPLDLWDVDLRCGVSPFDTSRRTRPSQSRPVQTGSPWMGLGGGTGAATVHVSGHGGLPGFVGVRRARAWLDEHGIDDVQLVAPGGYRTSAEMAEALALGADAIAPATASMMAIGCQQYLTTLHPDIAEHWGMGSMR